jgi:hypothetical protein
LAGEVSRSVASCRFRRPGEGKKERARRRTGAGVARSVPRNQHCASLSARRWLTSHEWGRLCASAALRGQVPPNKRRVRAGGSGKERETMRGRRGERMREKLVHAPGQPCSRTPLPPLLARTASTLLSRWLCPCSRAGSAPALALTLRPLLSRSRRPCSPTGKGGRPSPLCSRVVYARC